LCFYAEGDLVDTSPLIFVLCPAPDNAEAFKDVYDVVDATTLNAKLFGTTV
jgi:hypothetical protein